MVSCYASTVDVFTYNVVQYEHMGILIVRLKKGKATNLMQFEHSSHKDDKIMMVNYHPVEGLKRNYSG
jgi:hypothetical protein